MEESHFDMGADVMSALKSSTKKRTILKELDPIQEIQLAVNQNRPCTIISTPSLRVNGQAIQDSFEKYLGHPGIQSSNLKQALLTPFHYQYSREDDKQRLQELVGEKKYFQLGTFIHQCILEPRKFGRVIVEPKNSMTSTEGVNAAIEFWENILKNEPLSDGEALILDAITSVHEKGLNIEKIDGKRFYLEMLKSKTDIQPVSEEHFLKIKIIAKHLDNYGNGIIRKLVKGAKREISFYYNHPNGLPLKVRPDALAFEENVGVNAIISIKSTACEDLRAFEHQNAKLNYDLSEAMYQDVVSRVTGRKFKTTITIMLQTVEPFSIAVLIWSKDDIEVGHYKYESAMEKVLLAKEQGQYKGYDSYADNDDGLILMELPQWNNRELLPSI
jgi:hypothetical protein